MDEVDGRSLVEVLLLRRSAWVASEDESVSLLEMREFRYVNFGILGGRAAISVVAMLANG
jgi:hypothetical protein